MTIDTDAPLIEAARAGDHAAFARLVRMHHQGVRGFLRRACGNFAMADDLAQETFISAWERLSQFRGESCLRSWLCGIAWRKLLANRRSEVRARERDAAYHDLEQGDGPLDPRLRVALAKALTTLSLDQRACVAMCLAAGYSHSEAAHALEMPLGTVKSHVLRGREKLLAALGDGNDG
jgi:RNA polymerase sigma-70 factor (ECF subfamily)